MQAVFLDAGFTLLEPARSVADVYFEQATALGIDLDEPLFRQRLRTLWDRLSAFRSPADDLRSSDDLERDAWRRFTWTVADPFPQLQSVHADWLSRLFDWFDRPGAWRPVPGSEELLAELRRRNVAIGVVSNWHRALHGILAGTPLRQQVDFVVTSAEAGYKKPHVRIFHEALRRSGSRPERTVHVGDSWNEDVEGARAAGLIPIHLVRSDRASPVAPETTAGVRQIASVAEIATLLASD